MQAGVGVGDGTICCDGTKADGVRQTGYDLIAALANGYHGLVAVAQHVRQRFFVGVVVEFRRCCR